MQAHFCAHIPPLSPLNIILPTSKEQGLDHQILTTSPSLFQSILYFADSVLFTSQKGSCHRLNAVSCFSRSHRIYSKLCMGVLSLWGLFPSYLSPDSHSRCTHQPDWTSCSPSHGWSHQLCTLARSLSHSYSRIHNFHFLQRAWK